MRYMWSFCLVVLLGIGMCSCSRPGTPPSPAPSDQTTVGSNAELKERLGYIAESGMAGSALGGLREAVEKVGDASLVSDLNELEKATSPEQIKEIAKRMADKL